MWYVVYYSCLLCYPYVLYYKCRMLPICPVLLVSYVTHMTFNIFHYVLQDYTYMRSHAPNTHNVISLYIAPIYVRQHSFALQYYLSISHVFHKYVYVFIYFSKVYLSMSSSIYISHICLFLIYFLSSSISHICAPVKGLFVC